MADASAPLARCPRCGRTGTLTSLSAGNTCVMQDDCEAARQDALDRAALIAPGAEYDHLTPRQAAKAMARDIDEEARRG